MGIAPSARARIVGIDTVFKNLSGGAIRFLPQRVAVVGQGSSATTYSTDKRQVTSALEVGQTYGFGSPVHLAALQLLPSNGDGIGTIPLTIYPLEDDGAGVAAVGGIDPSGTPAPATYIIRINNIDSEPFAVDTEDTLDEVRQAITGAINSNINMPVLAAYTIAVPVSITSKWKGESGNDLNIEVVASNTEGVTFAITQPTSGATNPDVDAALNQIGGIWETLVLNCMETLDIDTLGKYQTFGEGRWGELVKKPLMVFTGSTFADVTNSILAPGLGKTDRVNSQLVAPGSKDLPLTVAARQLARIAVRANENPAYDYGSLQATGLTPGTDAEQWTYIQRDEAIKGGSSSIKVKDGVINLADTVTFYHPEGDPTPAYQYVVDVIKLQQIIYNIDLIFDSVEWDGAPLIPDDQPTTNSAAKKPKMAKAEMASMIDSLADNAIISDPKTAKDSIVAAINGSNPKRLDVELTVQLSGNANIISVDLNFGFYFGGA